jgi:CRP-like cAMP-binding protein
MGFAPAEIKSIAGMLGKSPLFASLDSKHLDKVVESAKELKYGPGDRIVRQGDSGVGFFMIVGGSADVGRGGKVLAKLGPGQYFGEMTLLDSQPRSADVTATSPTRCLVLSTMNFSSLLASNPRMAVELLRELARRLRATDKTLSE